MCPTLTRREEREAVRGSSEEGSRLTGTAVETGCTVRASYTEVKTEQVRE